MVLEVEIHAKEGDVAIVGEATGFDHADVEGYELLGLVGEFYGGDEGLGFEVEEEFFGVGFGEEGLGVFVGVY